MRLVGEPSFEVAALRLKLDVSCAASTVNAAGPRGRRKKSRFWQQFSKEAVLLFLQGAALTCVLKPTAAKRCSGKARGLQVKVVGIELL